MLDDLVADGSLVELHSMLRPAEDLALYRAEMAAWPGPGELADWQVALAGWVEANDDTRRDILAQLHDEGPCTARELPDTTLVPWRSSGWNDDRNVRRLLDMMVQRGEVAVAGTEGRDKLWDLAERVYPDDPPVPLEEAFRIRGERRLRALGIARRARHRVARRAQRRRPGRRGGARGGPARHLAGRPGVPGGPRRLRGPDRAAVARSTGWCSTAGGWQDLFAFDYQLEMYKPAAKRRWGYWALPGPAR